MISKGVILAAGRGSRLYPATSVIAKPLLPIFDKPMIYYALSILMQAKIREVCIVTNLRDLHLFKELLKDGHTLGMSISYRVQTEPKGIADVFSVAKDFINYSPCALVLGDNLFTGSDWPSRLALLQQTKMKGAHVFGMKVASPNRFGVMVFDEGHQLVDIIEKPESPPSNIAVTGLYFYDEQAIEMASTLKPSARNELEITDLNRLYILQNNINYTILSAEDDQWFDIGTHESMTAAIDSISEYITHSKQQIGCIEEIAFLNGWINQERLMSSVEKFSSTSYGQYLEKYC
jgi:glucose-1-phosphate thymidylyltransferase